MKVTLRDLLWLVLLIASITVWVDEHRTRVKAEGYRLRRHLREIFAGPTKDWLRRQSSIEEFAQMTDEELDEYFASQPPNQFYTRAENHFEQSTEYEPCLAELARRGLADQLQTHYDALLAQSGFTLPQNLELLTALRRAQGNPDPLEVKITLDSTRESRFARARPRLTATIANVDAGKEPFSLIVGGSYRPNRWKIVMTDEDGRRVAESSDLGLHNGGLSQIVPLAPGQKLSGWRYEFDLRRYLASPPSGKYKLQALYHNSVCIASERDVSGLIVSKSEPIWVEVTNRTVVRAERPQFAIRPPLAIAAACVVLTLVSTTRPRQRSTCESATGGMGGPATDRFPGLTRRDFCWGMLVVGISLGMWLDDRPNRPAHFGQTPDAAADWSIRLVDGPTNKAGSQAAGDQSARMGTYN